MTNYCGQEYTEHGHFNFIKTRVEYNNYGIYKTLIARIWNIIGAQYILDYLKLNTVHSPPDQIPTGITLRCFYKRVEKQNNTIYSETKTNSYEIKKTLWSNRRRLIGFRQDIEFWWKVNSWEAMEYDRIMIECHQY